MARLKQRLRGLTRSLSSLLSVLSQISQLTPQLGHIQVFPHQGENCLRVGQDAELDQADTVVCCQMFVKDLF